MDYKERWAFLLRAKNLSMRQFCNDVNTTTSNYYYWVKNNSFPDTKATRAIKELFPDLNLNWLFFEQGEPFLDESILPPPPDKDEFKEVENKKQVHKTSTPNRVPEKVFDHELIARLERIETFLEEQVGDFAVVGKNRVYLRSEMYLNYAA
ncbi:transcriptional regulator [Flexithrix dorotheae]|uniref:transcriptional regulator n=1 Tax=Flexithrix dorotheae TaxID=70993 RepID=UPI00038125AF|nr:transcriptional regulator [Flexithrix dorotheae]